MRYVLALSLAICPVLFAAADDLHPIAASVKSKLKNPDKPFVMAVIVKVKSGSEDKFESAFADAVKETRKEPGNVAYELYKSADDEGQYVVYEKWKNLDALAEHLKKPYLTKTLEAVGDLVESAPKINVLTPAGQ